VGKVTRGFGAGGDVVFDDDRWLDRVLIIMDKLFLFMLDVYSCVFLLVYLLDLTSNFPNAVFNTTIVMEFSPSTFRASFPLAVPDSAGAASSRQCTALKPVMAMKCRTRAFSETAGRPA
jgi:ribosomal protein L40E